MEDFSKEKFKSFRDISEYFGSGKPVHDDGIVKVEHIDELPLDMVLLNTAWMTSAAININGVKSDERRMLLPEAAIRKGISLCRDGTLRVIISHHPTNWLTEFAESDFLETAVEADRSLYLHLFGHNHEVRPTEVSRISGYCLSNQAGALYTKRNRYNGYALIRIDPEKKHSAVHLRSFFDKRREFDKGVDICADDGVFTPTAEAKRYWYKVSRRIDYLALRKWIATKLFPATMEIYNDGLGDRPLSDVFVEPPLYSRRDTRNDVEDEISEELEVSISLKQILESKNNYILHGRQEYGKTTLLQQMALKLMEKVKKDDSFLTVPIMIDFSKLRPGRNAIERVLRGGLLADSEGVSVISFLEEGLITVLIDDVVFDTPVAKKLLREFFTKYPKNRFILSSTDNETDRVFVQFGSELVPDTESPIEFEHVFLKSLTRKKMRSLVKKWDPNGELDQEETLIG